MNWFNMNEIILSITTWKGRLYTKDLPKNLYKFLYKQKTKYNYKVVLVLSEEEFPNKEKDVPEEILLLKNEKRFEILWTYKNTKAFKKLEPVREKYPDAIIITTDDDIELEETCIEQIMNNYDGKTIISHGVHYDDFGYNLPLVWGVRCFPPNSLYKLNNEEFSTYFNNMQDDEWNGIRIVLNKTPVKALWHLLKSEYAGDQSKAFRKEYFKFDMKSAIKKWFMDHPKEYSLFNEHIKHYKNKEIYK